MGGQACVFYGGAEFSRDIDFAILADEENLAQITAALEELQAKVIAVPAFSLEHLHKGHAVHFRCRHPDADGMRVDLMAKMRGVEDFCVLWDRRTTLEGRDGTIYELMSLPDLVRAKKTQRDKDWPMIRRLIEADHAAAEGSPEPGQIVFWLREARTPALLVDLAVAHPAIATSLLKERPLLHAVLKGDMTEIDRLLHHEESAEREADRVYWAPLRQELEKMRHP